jgi:hypothetical protein
MKLDVQKLRALGVPEDLIEAATTPASRVLKEKRRKLYINQTREAAAIFRILCLLDRSKPTPEATRAVEFHMAEMAARVEQRYGALQAQIQTAFGVPSQSVATAAKGKRATRR